ncbi:unnamed protein product [Durusdinium trenchii]|uniref:NYN domain-containing protein n=1 Tax=Durusdinium trenchii TaxID=1381693 RepID=A0ABP0MPX4_9DINO
MRHRRLTAALVLAAPLAFAPPLRRPAAREKAMRALEAEKALEETQDTAERPPSLHIFWDLENKIPERLEDTMACLLQCFPGHQLKSVRLYTSFKSLGFMPSLMNFLTDVKGNKSFPQLFPNGARFPLLNAAPLAALDAQLVVVPARWQAADFWLVRETARMVAPWKWKTQAEPDLVCLVSDDSDFRQIVLEIQRSGLRCAVLCGENSWTLRKRADLWLNWSNVSFGRKDCGEGDEDRGTEGIALGAPEALPMESSATCAERAEQLGLKGCNVLRGRETC